MLVARLANCLWVALNLRRERRFRRALRDPARAQEQLLQSYLRRNADTVVGRRYGFSGLGSVRDFQNRVPLRSYDEMAPDIERVRRGEAAVLTREPILRLVPSSGSTAARKLIPFSGRSHEEFQRAIGPWIVDLRRRRPRALSGRAYWSVSPQVDFGLPDTSAVPIGFDDDSAYLGSAVARLVDLAMAVPSSVRFEQDLGEFRFATLRHLVAARELSLISVWHPSFLSLLLDDLPNHWPRILAELPPKRATELAGVDPSEVAAIWPRLDVVSCWRDAHAALPARDLERRLPGVAVEAKGLLATEAVVTVPYGGLHPPALRSHFFEFLDDAGKAHTVDELHEGREYTVVVTTGGGLYRYRLGDRVRVAGKLDSTPCLQFVGRNDRVSDLRGEKLSEGFVTAVLERVLSPLASRVRFAMLAPEDESDGGVSYRLFLEFDGPKELVASTDLARRLDAALEENPHYELCRSLGQLGPAGVSLVSPNAHQVYLEHQRRRGQRLGDVKPTALTVDTGWTEVFPEARHAVSGYFAIQSDSSRNSNG